MNQGTRGNALDCIVLCTNERETENSWEYKWWTLRFPKCSYKHCNEQSCQVNWKKGCRKWSLMHVYGCTNNILMIFLSTAQSQYSFKWLMICYIPQLGKSRPSGLPQWQPVIDGSHTPVRHSHHVSTATIASSVAAFNQSSQTESTRVLQTLPAVHWSASQKNQQSERPSLNLLDVISDFAWLCPTLCHYSTWRFRVWACD